MKKITERFDRNSVYLNNHADLSQLIERLTLRCVELENKKDIDYFKKVQSLLIRIGKEMAVTRKEFE
jgi:hypothetical protein